MTESELTHALDLATEAARTQAYASALAICALESCLFISRRIWSDPDSAPKKIISQPERRMARSVSSE